VNESDGSSAQTKQETLMQQMNIKSKKMPLRTQGKLSAREIEILKLICSEHTNQEISEQLFLSKRTIESHRKRISEKVGAKNTVGLVVYAIANEIHQLSQNPAFVI
jgi:DNA-binding CsgD family transcriptional regulator